MKSANLVSEDARNVHSSLRMLDTRLLRFHQEGATLRCGCDWKWFEGVCCTRQDTWVLLAVWFLR